MQEQQITITLEKAKEWYNSDNATLKEIALQAFSEEELNVFDFTKIKSFEDALRYFSNHNYDKYVKLREMAVNLSIISKASAAMFKLNIVRKVLNTNYDLHLTKNVDGQKYTWYPCFRLIAKDCTFELKNGTLNKIGKIVNEGVTYDVLGGCASFFGGNAAGVGYFYSHDGVGLAYSNIGFLGCATKEIAQHFGKYFGMLILEAMYGDMVDFHIIEATN